MAKTESPFLTVGLAIQFHHNLPFPKKSIWDKSLYIKYRELGLASPTHIGRSDDHETIT